MKIAFMYSGYIRNLKEFADQHKEIIDDLNADVFGSFWSSTDSEEEHDNIGYFRKKFDPVAIEVDDIESLKESVCFDDVKGDIKLDISSFREDWVSRFANFTSFFMWYKVWRVNALRCEYKEKYDIVVRIRTDLDFKRGFNPEKNDFINIPSGFVFINPDIFGPHDILAYGKPSLMNYYCSLFQSIHHYIKTNEFVLQPENLLRVHLSQKDFVVRMWEDEIGIGLNRGSNVDTGFNYFLHGTTSWKRPAK